MNPDQQELDSRIDPDVPQEDFDEIFFSLLAEWNTRALVMEVPNLYFLVATYFKDQVKAQWQQESVLPSDMPHTESQDASEVHEWCCAVCDEDLPHGHCPAHPYARTYDAMVD